jgi:hypothetical protein
MLWWAAQMQQKWKTYFLSCWEWQKVPGCQSPSGTVPAEQRRLPGVAYIQWLVGLQPPSLTQTILEGHCSFRVPSGVPEAFAESASQLCRILSFPILLLLPPFLRDWPPKSIVPPNNLLHANLHLWVCFSGNKTCDTLLYKLLILAKLEVLFVCKMGILIVFPTWKWDVHSNRCST